MSRSASTLAEPSVLETPEDESRLGDFYREHQDFVWRNARRLGAADEWVDDAVQEVFLVAVRRLSELGPDANVRGWLFAIVVRVIARLRRNRGRYRSRIQRYAEVAPAAYSPSAANAGDAASLLRSLLAQLDDTKRVIVILIELEGMTSAEASKVLGIPQGTVDSRLRAARKELEKIIERELPAGERRSL